MYSRPGIDSATTSNSSAVSRQGNNNVGVAQGVLPTSDTKSVSKDNISQTGEKSNSQPQNVTKKAVAKITVKETVENGQRIYSVELLEIMKPTDMENSSQSSSVGAENVPQKILGTGSPSADTPVAVLKKSCLFGRD